MLLKISKKTYLTFPLLFLLGFFLEAQTLLLDIKGSNSAETSIIDSLAYQKEYGALNEMKKETDTLVLQLQKIGYPYTNRTPLKKENDSVFSTLFSLGDKFDKITIYYPRELIELKKLKKITPEVTEKTFTIPYTQVERALTYINNEIANQGKPFNYVQLSAITADKKNHSLIATLTSNSPKKRTIDKIIVKGYDQFPKAFIKNFIGLKKGQVFNKRKIERKTDALKNLRFARSIRKPEVLFTKDSSILYLYLEKQNSNLFDGFLGFATNEETSKLEINGNATLQLINNLNKGESLIINYKNDGKEQQRFNGKLEIPFLFNTPFGLGLELDLFKKDSTFTTTEQKAKLTYRLNPKISLNTGYRTVTSNFLLDEEDIVTGQNFTDYNSDFFTIGGNYLDINDYQSLTPVKTAIELSIETGKRITENQTTNQIGIRFRGNHIVQLDFRNSIYINNETAYLQSTDYLENELYRFGGINSLRGFEENSITASLYSSFQTEYRYLLASNFYAHSIIDYAYVENNLYSLRENLYGIGFGLGLKTKAGLLKVAFANGKSDGQNFEFRNTKIHLSLLAVF